MFRLSWERIYRGGAMCCTERERGWGRKRRKKHHTEFYQQIAFISNPTTYSYRRTGENCQVFHLFLFKEKNINDCRFGLIGNQYIISFLQQAMVILVRVYLQNNLKWKEDDQIKQKINNKNSYVNTVRFRSRQPREVE